MKKLTFIVPFAPFANQETRLTKGGFCFTPKAKKDFMKRVSEYLDEYKGYFKGIPSLKITILCVCDRPKSAPAYVPTSIWKKQVSFYKSSRPDGDNYLKPLQDSLSHHIISKVRVGKTNRFKIVRGAGIVDDDSSFVDTRIIKIHRKIGEEQYYKITIKEINLIYEPNATISVNRNSRVRNGDSNEGDQILL